jgi:phospholipid transport system substrate-binding protein
MSRISFRSFFGALAVALTFAVSATAFAQTPDQFVQSGHAQLTQLLQQPSSAQRDAQIAAAFDQMIDYTELARRCFQQHWSNDLDASKQAEVTDLLKQIVRKNYQKRLKDTLNFNITYTGQRTQGSDMLVRTVAQSRVNTRDPAVQIDYVVEGGPNGPYHVVDIVAENSSTVTNYYRDFHRFLTTQGQGYPYLVEKLKAKIAHLNATP